MFHIPYNPWILIITLILGFDRVLIYRSKIQLRRAYTLLSTFTSHCVSVINSYLNMSSTYRLKSSLNIRVMIGTQRVIGSGAFKQLIFWSRITSALRWPQSYFKICETVCCRSIINIFKVNIDHKNEAKKCSNSHSACIGICWNLQAKIEVSQTQSSDLKTPLCTFNWLYQLLCQCISQTYQ